MRKTLAFAACSMIALGTLSTPALAVPTDNATVTFNGTLTDSCTVVATGDGTMAAASDGLSMGTEETGGSPAGVSVAAIGTPPVVVFSAPQLASSPSGYSGSPTMEIKYSATGATSQSSYTAVQSSSTLSGGAATYTVHGRLADSGGLHGGNYSMTTLATCGYD